MMLVTVEQAKQRLYIDTSFYDADLELMIEGASGAVLNHLKGANRFVQELDVDGNPVVDADGKPVYTEEVLPEILNAVLLLVGYMNKDRDNDRDKEWDEVSLPRPIRVLLNPLRDPALA